jgi:hypothetical protein
MWSWDLGANATGESEPGPLRLQFDCSVKLAFRGSSISSDGGLLLHRELDDALGLTDMAVGLIADPRTGKNGRHGLAGFLRQSVFSRLAGCEDVNDAGRLCRDPVMRQLIAGLNRPFRSDIPPVPTCRIWRNNKHSCNQN